MTSARRLCRLCLEPEIDGKFTNIFARNSETAKQILLLTGLKIKPIKNIPSLICQCCLINLYEFQTFRTKCLESDQHFLKEFGAQNYDSDESTNNCWTNTELKVTAEAISDILKTKTQTKLKPRRSKSRYKPICGYCGKEQESEYRLKQHELLSHTPLETVSHDELFVCDKCGRSFKTKQSIRNHFIRAHTPKNEVFPCSICGKVLPHQKALYAHERVHIKTEVICQYCSKSFTRKVLLSSHIAIVHLKKRLSPCPYCDHQAITNGALKKHIRCKHLNIRAHHCEWPECGKSFHENQHLIRHYRSHTNERPYECRHKGCDKAFSDHAKRTRHEKQNCPQRHLKEQE